MWLQEQGWGQALPTSLEGVLAHKCTVLGDESEPLGMENSWEF